MRYGLVFLALVGCDDTLYGQPEETNDLVYSSDWDGVRELSRDLCEVCHVEGGTSPDLVLPAAIEADLEQGGGRLVVPGDPEASLLWTVLEDGSMPIGAPLSEAQIGHVKAWIEDGAVVP